MPVGPPENATRLAELREEAYAKVLRAFTKQTFDWKREKVLTDLRKELEIGNDVHSEFMQYVLEDRDPPRVAAAAARSLQRTGSSVARKSAGQDAFGGQPAALDELGMQHDAHAQGTGFSGGSITRPGSGQHMDAGPMSMPGIPPSMHDAAFPGQQHAAWQRQQQAMRMQQHHGASGYFQHPQQQALAMQYGGQPLSDMQQPGRQQHQLAHGHMAQLHVQNPHAEFHTGGGFGQAPPFGSPQLQPGHPFGSGQDMWQQQQHQHQQRGDMGGARPMLPHHLSMSAAAMQHMGGGGQQSPPLDAYVGMNGPATPPAPHGSGAHGSTFAPSPTLGGLGPGRGGGGSKDSPGGNRAAKAKLPPKKRQAPGGDSGPQGSKQPAKKKKTDVSPQPGAAIANGPVGGNPAALKLDPLLGHRVQVYWPTAGGWWDGVITDYNAMTGQHCVVYDMNTESETFEWTQIRSANSAEVRVLPEKVNLLQARPAGGGVPGQVQQQSAQPQQSPAAPATKPPPKQRKPKAASAGGSRGGGGGGGGSSSQTANGRPASAAAPKPPRTAPPKVAPKPWGNGALAAGSPVEMGVSTGGGRDAYRDQQPPQRQQSLPHVHPQQGFEQPTARPPPPQPQQQQPHAYSFRVVQGSDSGSDQDSFSDESYD